MPKVARAHCGHDLAAGDLHQLCYSCRVHPRKKYPRFHPCQMVNGRQGEGRCVVCEGVTDKVRQSWVPKRSYQGI